MARSVSLNLFPSVLFECRVKIRSPPEVGTQLPEIIFSKDVKAVGQGPGADGGPVSSGSQTEKKQGNRQVETSTFFRPGFVDSFLFRSQNTCDLSTVFFGRLYKNV